MINNFTLIEKIGEGGFSEVYKAKDNTGKYVAKNDFLAIKILNLYSNSNVIDNEKNICMKLNDIDNNNIIKFYDYLEYDNKLYIYMEYINGIELFDYITDTNNVLTDNEIKQIIIQMINALNFLHAEDISHGDIKLENFMITSDNQIILIDFGLCNFTNKELYEKKGTAMYAAPELVCIDDKGYDGKKIDMWALGTVIYILKYKSYPFLGRSLSIIPEKFKSESDKSHYLSDNVHHPLKYKNNPFVSIIDGLICKDINKRLDITKLNSIIQ